MIALDLLFALLLGAGTALALGTLALPLPRPSTGARSAPSRREERRWEADLPFALERVASALSAGCSLQQALALTRETPGPGSGVGRLFDPVLDRVRAGESLEDSLRREGARFRGRSLPLAFLTMATALRSGTNLVESLHILARVSRDRQTMRKRVEALTAQGRLQGLILSLTPLFFLAALGLVSPGSLHLLGGTALGRAFLLTAVLLDALGGLVIRRMIGKEIY